MATKPVQPSCFSAFPTSQLLTLLTRGSPTITPASAIPMPEEGLMAF